MFSLVPSVFLKQSYLCLVIVSLISLWLLPYSFVGKFFTSLVVLSLGMLVYKKQLKTLTFVKVKQLDEKNWLLQTQEKSVFYGQLQGDTLINSLFSIIILKSNTSKQTKKLVVCKDMLPKGQYHRLILGLKGLLM